MNGIRSAVARRGDAIVNSVTARQWYQVAVWRVVNVRRTAEYEITASELWCGIQRIMCPHRTVIALMAAQTKIGSRAYDEQEVVIGRRIDRHPVLAVVHRMTHRAVGGSFVVKRARGIADRRNRNQQKQEVHFQTRFHHHYSDTAACVNLYPAA